MSSFLESFQPPKIILWASESLLRRSLPLWALNSYEEHFQTSNTNLTPIFLLFPVYLMHPKAAWSHLVPTFYFMKKCKRDKKLKQKKIINF